MSRSSISVYFGRYGILLLDSVAPYVYEHIDYSKMYVINFYRNY